MHTAQPARERGVGKVRVVQGTRAGDRGCTADGRLREAQRRPATMPTESISTPSISLMMSEVDAHLLDLKRILKDACGARHTSRQQAKRPARGREAVSDEH